jgi:hypothetical protein
MAVLAKVHPARRSRRRGYRAIYAHDHEGAFNARKAPTVLLIYARRGIYDHICAAEDDYSHNLKL